MLKDLASSYKLTKHYCTRNETALLTLLEKYCKLKGLEFRFQAKLDVFTFDALIENMIAVEFDEPHHRYGRDRGEGMHERPRSQHLLVSRWSGLI